MRPTWATPGQSRWGNTVVIVRALLDRPENDVSVALGCFGGGSMLDALLLPRILDRLPDRAVMLPAAGLLGAVLRAFAGLLGGAAWFSGGTLTTLALDGTWLTLLASWVLLGIGYSAVQTPTGRLLRRSAQPPTGRRCSWRSSRSLMLAG
jgi:hypothetical protein